MERFPRQIFKNFKKVFACRLMSGEYGENVFVIVQQACFWYRYILFYNKQKLAQRRHKLLVLILFKVNLRGTRKTPLT